MALVAIIVGTLSLTRMAQINDNLGDMKTQHVDSLQQVAELRGGIADMFRGMLVYSVSPAAEKQQSLKAFTDAMKHYRALRDTVVFQMPMTGGYTVPAPDRIGAEFASVEAEMNKAVAALQKAEDTEADASSRAAPRTSRPAHSS